MIPRIRTYEDVVSAIDHDVSRAWGPVVNVTAPIDLQSYGTHSVLYLPREAIAMSDVVKAQWIIMLGNYILRGGELRWMSP